MMDLREELKGTYRVITKESTEKLTLQIKPAESWSYFQGHFPSLPILPAVAIADISRFFIEAYILKQKFRLKKISFFKIRTPVRPSQSLLVTIQKEDQKKFAVNWTNETESSISAELNIELA